MRRACHVRASVACSLHLKDRHLRDERLAYLDHKPKRCEFGMYLGKRGKGEKTGESRMGSSNDL